MAVKYVFGCPQCNRPLELTATQAGQALVCDSCEAAFSAPRLGDIKKLPVAGAGAGAGAGSAETSVAANARAAAQSPSLAKRWLFTAGLLLAVAAGIGAFAVQRHAQNIHVDFDLEEVIAENNKLVDQAPASEIYQITVAAGKEEFVLEWREAPYKAANKQSSVLQGVANGLWVAAGTGLLLLIASFVVGGKNR